MADMQVGVANIDEKGFYSLMEDKTGTAVASSNPSLQVSISFGKFENDELSWEKFSTFSPNKYLEEVGKCATPGSVAQKKAYFEAHYKKIAERKAEIMDQEEQIDENGESRVDEGSTEQFTYEKDKLVADIAAEVKELSIDEISEETIIVKECRSSVDEAKEVKESIDSLKVVKPEEIADMQEKPKEVNESIDTSKVVKSEEMQEKPKEVVLQVDEEEETKVREEFTNETPTNEVKKGKKQNLIKKKDGNARINPTRSSPMVTTKPETKKIITSRRTPPSKQIGNTIKTTRKPVPPISKSSPGLSNPRVYKQPPSQITSMSASNKQTGSKSLHISLSLDPSASDPTGFTSTRKSLIMERMGDKDIVKRAFKTFRKSFDFKDEQNQSPVKTSSIPSVATRKKEDSSKNRSTKASSLEKRSNLKAEKQQKELTRSGVRSVEKTELQKNRKAGAIDAKTQRDPKAKSMHGSLPKQTLPKRSLDKVL